MKYYGITEYWDYYISKAYRGTPIKNFLVFVLMGCVFASDYMRGEYEGLSLFWIFIMALSPIVIGVILYEYEYYSLTKNETCHLICRGIRHFNSESTDKNTKIYADLELKEHSFVINGVFQGEKYFFITNEIYYRDIVSINTDFNERFEISCQIINDLHRRETITLDIYNIYYIDNEGMKYFYDKYCQYQKKRS